MLVVTYFVCDRSTKAVECGTSQFENISPLSTSTAQQLLLVILTVSYWRRRVSPLRSVVQIVFVSSAVVAPKVTFCTCMLAEAPIATLKLWLYLISGYNIKIDF